jgi:hypothetical protein
MQQFGAAQIDNTNTIVLQLSDEDVLARAIECEMIDASFHSSERYFALEFQKCIRALLGDGQARGQPRRQGSQQASCSPTDTCVLFLRQRMPRVRSAGHAANSSQIHCAAHFNHRRRRPEGGQSKHRR